MQDLKTSLKIYLENNLAKEKPRRLGFFKITKELCTEECREEKFNVHDLYEEEKQIKRKASNINDYINEHEGYSNFQTMLFKFIDDKNLKDADVYNKVHIDRRLFSKIRSDKNYHPSKETIILLSLALELDEHELDNLLESASYSLPKNNKYDLIIRFCFINKIFKIKDINELLFEHNCKLFNY